MFCVCECDWTIIKQTFGSTLGYLGLSEDQGTE